MARKITEQRRKGSWPKIEPWVVPTNREEAERARQGSGKGAKGGFMSQWLLPRVLGDTYPNSKRH